MGKSAWKMTPETYGTGNGEPYLGGLEESGQKIINKMNIPEMEIDLNHEFIQFSRPDIMGSCQHISQSVRTGMNDKAMRMNPVTNDFSTNKHLTFYKQT